MAFELPKPVLRKLRILYNANPLQLTTTEQEIAGRIQICSKCENVWMQRTKKCPSRCPTCHSRGWNRPLITALLVAQSYTETQPTPNNKKEPQP